MEVAERQVLAGPKSALRSLALLSLLMLIGGTVASWAIARRIARPLREITQAAESIAQGSFARGILRPFERRRTRRTAVVNLNAIETVELVEVARGRSDLARARIGARGVDVRVESPGRPFPRLDGDVAVEGDELVEP